MKAKEELTLEGLLRVGCPLVSTWDGAVEAQGSVLKFPPGLACPLQPLGRSPTFLNHGVPPPERPSCGREVYVRAREALSTVSHSESALKLVAFSMSPASCLLSLAMLPALSAFHPQPLAGGKWVLFG